MPVALIAQKGPAFARLEMGHPLPEKHLPLDPWRMRIGIERQHRRDHPHRRAFREPLCRDLAAQRRMRHPVIGEMTTPVHHRPSISGSAPSSARAPMPTPPLGRAGAALGLQP